MKTIKYILLVSILITSFGTIVAQQDNALYFMDKVPQVNLVNPAKGCDCKINVWGLMVPVFGQVPPPISFNFGNTGFSLKKAFKYGQMNVWDSIVDNTSDSLVPDFDYLLKAMRPINYLTTDLQIHLLGAGYKFNDWYFDIGITEKVNFSFGYPKDLFGLIWKGNGAYLNDPVSLSGLGVNFTHYREYSTGAARKISDKLKVGGHVKWLFGKANMYTRKSDINLYTDPNTFDLRLKSDYEFSVSLPDSIIIDYDNGNGIADSMKLDVTTGAIDIPGYVMNRKNFGVALDLGATYKLNDKIQLEGSILDIGFIRWKTNTYTFKQNGDFTFTGVDVPPLLNPNNNVDSLIQNFADSVYQNFMVADHNKKYNSFLPTKIYIGGTYKYNDFVNFGLLTRTEVYQRSLHLSVTLSANTNFYKWLSATMTYSMINRYYLNIGLGLSAKASFMQFYIITDNFFGIRPEKSTGAVLPYSSRNMNLRFGCNLIFGCPKQITKSFL